MEPIISPWLIYLLGFSENLGIIVSLLAFIFGAGAGIVFLVGLFGAKDNDKDLMNVHRRFRYIKWLFVVFLVLSIVTPSKNTLIGMIVVQNITENNIKKAVVTGRDLKDEIKKDIIDILQGLESKKRIYEERKKN